VLADSNKQFQRLQIESHRVSGGRGSSRRSASSEVKVCTASFASAKFWSERRPLALALARAGVLFAPVQVQSSTNRRELLFFKDRLHCSIKRV
jgi:hypothetical protein